MTLEINQTINQLVIQQTTGNTLEITTQGPQGPAGPSTTFTVAGNSGPSQTIGNGDTLTLTSPVAFQQVVMSAVDTATFEWPNQTGNVFLASPANGSAGTPAFRAIVFADLDAVLGTMAQQDANAVAITGGTMSAVAITLGSINNTPIGGTTPSTGAFTSLTTTLTINSTGRITGQAGINIQSGGNSIMQDVSNSMVYIAQNSAAIPIIVRGRTSQSGDLQQWQDPSANVLSFIAAGGPATFGSLTAGTNDTLTTLTIRRNSTGTPAANFASQVVYQLESSTTENTQAAGHVTSWVVATHASRTARQVFNIYDTAAREAMRLEASGSAAMIGFYGETATIRYATTGTTTGFTAGAGAAVDSAATFTGNVGATAYTIGDIVRALKLVGIMTQ